MNRLFLCQSTDAIYKAYTKTQIGAAPRMTWAQFLANPLPQTQYIFSTWGMPPLSVADIKTHLPNLKAVFYAAGSVQGFARPFLSCGVQVFSAWAANAIPVAEFTVGQILLANKGFFQLHNRYKQGYDAVMRYAQGFPGNYNTTVGLLGAGMIGRYVLQLLKPFSLTIQVFDPFLSKADAATLGVQKAELIDVFSTCQTISNHLANNAQTKGMLNYRHFSAMGANATFLNTGRGAQVVQADLLRALREEPTRTAVLDVTDPQEPLSPQSTYWQYPNIVLTPHRAGSISNEIYRMGAYMQQEFEALTKGEPTRFAVTATMLETMA